MANSLDSIVANLQNYVVAPAAIFGLAGLVFDVEGESIADLSADITDHYTEDNKALQDHIAIKPKRITLKGYQGEVIYGNPNNTIGFLQKAIQKLTAVSAYLPSLAAGTEQLIESIQANKLPDTTLSSAADLYGAVKSLIPVLNDCPRQASVYAYFKSLMTQGILLSVQTPWEFMTNMAIESVIAIQAEGTKTITDFSVKLKEIRIAKTQTAAYNTTLPGQSGQDPLGYTGNYPAVLPVQTVPLDVPELQGAAGIQGAVQQSIGNVPGVGLPTSVLPGWQSQLNTVEDITSNPGAMSVFNFAVKPASH